MDKKKTIGITALISLMVVAVVSPQFFDEPHYYCDIRPELGLVQCDGFSKYVADNGQCIRNDNTNLRCRSGWALVVNDVIPEPQIESKSLEDGMFIIGNRIYKLESDNKVSKYTIGDNDTIGVFVSKQHIDSFTDDNTLLYGKEIRSVLKIES